MRVQMMRWGLALGAWLLVAAPAGADDKRREAPRCEQRCGDEAQRCQEICKKYAGNDNDACFKACREEQQRCTRGCKEGGR